LAYTPICVPTLPLQPTTIYPRYLLKGKTLMPIHRWISAVVLCAVSVVYAQDSSVPYKELRWRCIGPFRAGRTVAIAGIPDQPNVFFMAPNNGGVWKTDDFGRTWTPIFDGQPTGSIGAMALAPSDPNII